MEKKMGVVSDGRMRVFCLVLTAFAATAARAEVQIDRLYDVVVVGGGPAGIGAALAAARRCDPREIPLADIKAGLSKIGHIVPVPGCSMSARRCALRALSQKILQK